MAVSFIGALARGGIIGGIIGGVVTVSDKTLNRGRNRNSGEYLIGGVTIGLALGALGYFAGSTSVIFCIAASVYAAPLEPQSVVTAAIFGATIGYAISLAI